MYTTKDPRSENLGLANGRGSGNPGVVPTSTTILSYILKHPFLKPRVEKGVSLIVGDFE